MTALLLAAAMASPETLVALSAARERDVLPEAPLSVDVDVWRGIVRLGVRDAPRYVRGMKLGGLCKARPDGASTVELTCHERRLVARPVDEGGRHFLDLYVLRGVPWTDAAEPPLTMWPLSLVAPGDTCPGRSPEARAECAIRDARWDDAAAALEQARTGVSKAYAQLRLGMLAMSQGRVTDAVAAWAEAPSGGPFGRVATARRCELDGLCLGTSSETSAFDALGIPEPLRTEQELRRMRLWALTDHVELAARALTNRIADGNRSDPCDGHSLLCRRIVLATLSEPTLAIDGLALFLSIPDPTRGPLAGPLTRAAARETERLGAPSFAARLLAGASGSLEGDTLRETLREAARLFLSAGDPVRAAVVCRYGALRFGPGALAWCHAPDAPPVPTPLPVARLTQDVSVALDTAAAARARARSSDVR